MLITLKTNGYRLAIKVGRQRQSHSKPYRIQAIHRHLACHGLKTPMQLHSYSRPVEPETIRRRSLHTDIPTPQEAK